MLIEFTQYIDLAQITLYLFWIFFFGLIYWLRKEDRREGYPLEKDNPRIVGATSNLLFPSPKRFLLPDGSHYMAPDFQRDTRDIAAERTARSGGSTLEPTGDPMLDGVGPAAWADRHDEPELGREGHPAVVPLRAAPDFRVSAGPDVRGWPVIAGDGEVAGTVSEIWVDRLDMLIRYLEVELADPDAAEAAAEASASDDSESDEEQAVATTAAAAEASADEEEEASADEEEEASADEEEEADADEKRKVKASAAAEEDSDDEDEDEEEEEEYDEDPEPPRVARSASTEAKATRLVPMPLVKVSRGKRVVIVSSIHAKHFANVPTIKDSSTITALEEERISAYFAGGRLYADPKRLGPLV